jgi:hypothetical protein
MCQVSSGALIAFRHFLGQHGLAGAGLALDEQRPLQHDRGIHRDLEVIGRDIVLGTGKFHQDALSPFNACFLRAAAKRLP